MISQLIFAVVTVLTLTVSSQQANAVEVLSAAELSSHCEEQHKEPAGRDTEFCIRYIQGFIDGAVATDERVLKNVVKEYERTETLTERATRLRGPGSHALLERFGATYYADFCLGDPVPLLDVVTKIVDHLKAKPTGADRRDARTVVYQVLREEYACPQS